MNYNETPMVRLEVNHMKHTMLAALNEHTDDIKRALDTGIERFLLTLPEHFAHEMDRMSQDIASDAMRTALEEYWNTGAGRQQIDSVIRAKFSGAAK